MIIGIIGKAFCGKTTTSKVLQRVGLENGVFLTKVAMADEVKRIARDCFFWDGKKDERGRKLLQLIGTEVGRAYDENMWVKHWQSYANRLTANGLITSERVISCANNNDFKIAVMTYVAKCQNGAAMFKSGVVTDDIRFPNEIQAVIAYHGIVLKVECSEETRQKHAGDQSLGLQGHESERYADTLPYDFTLKNDGDEKALETSIKELWPKMVAFRRS